MVVDFRMFKKFDYEQADEDKNDIFILGSVVIGKADEDIANDIGVIIQRHGNNEYRTDMFGNCCSEEIRLATKAEILKFRKKLLTEL